MSATNTDKGEISLSRLLSTLSLVLHPETYVFATVPSSAFNAEAFPNFPVPWSDILLFFREPCTSSASSDSSPSEDRNGDQQVTLILRLDVAEHHSQDLSAHNLKYTYRCRMITCNVHSSLEAVGFMAALSTRLAEKGISTNPVSAYFHDHLFVPVETAEEAVDVLEGIRDEALRQQQQPRQDE